MKTWFVILLMLFSSSNCYGTNASQQSINQATQLLKDANELFKSGEVMEAGMKDLEVFKIENLPDDIYASAYLLMGDVCIATGDIQISETSYKRILKLKNASERNKAIAENGLALINEFKQHSEHMH